MTRSSSIMAILVLAPWLSACGSSGSSDLDGMADGMEDGTPDGTMDTAGDPVTDSLEESDSPDIPPAPNPIPDTAQYSCYASSGSVTTCPDETGAAFGQDAQYLSTQPAYADNGDGTVTDLVTGLMWQRDPGEKMTYDESVAALSGFDLAGYSDWRLPTIKELYSLILFTGQDPSGCASAAACPDVIPFIDTTYFDFEYGDESVGDRMIDSQWTTSTLYVDPSSWDGQQMFGVNFADGRIKGYGTGPMPGGTEDKGFFTIYVRGGDGYGTNDFVDNGDGTINDASTGLTWMQQDSGHLFAGDLADGSLLWEQALDWCEDLEYAGYADWRLPNVKELQSIVDYTRSPGTTSSAAIDPLFQCTGITSEGGEADYPYFWSSTTHANTNGLGPAGAYVCFGRCLGYMMGSWTDVHGAGAQRSDPKTGDPDDYPTGFGPQGDAIRIFNWARCVRGGAVLGDPVIPDPPVCGDDLCEPPEDETSCPEDCTGSEPVCGDTICEPPDEDEITCPEDCGGGPTSCTSDADCEAPGACPAEATLGCTCEPTPMGTDECIPNCNVDADCPSPPGTTLICDGGLCIPA